LCNKWEWDKNNKLIINKEINIVNRYIGVWDIFIYIMVEWWGWEYIFAIERVVNIIDVETYKEICIEIWFMAEIEIEVDKWISEEFFGIIKVFDR
jgi:hypothetical protein